MPSLTRPRAVLLSGGVYWRARGWATRHRHVVPVRLRRLLREAERAADPLIVRRYRRRTGERRPIPPRGLRERTGVDSVNYWFESVEEGERPLHELLARAGTRVEQLERVLDFGCGAGKVLCALRGRGPELHGCDIHAPSIEWLAQTYPDLHVVVNSFDPPLAYPSGHFDLVWAWSVLTHLDAERQRAWVSEWARIIRPGGLVLATFLAPELAGERAAELGVRDDLSERVRERGTVFVRAPVGGAFSEDFAGTAEPYGDAFNSEEAIGALARAAELELVEMVPRAVWGNQHCAIMQARRVRHSLRASLRSGARAAGAPAVRRRVKRET